MDNRLNNKNRRTVHNITLNDFIKNALAFTLGHKEEVNRFLQGEGAF